MNDDLEYCDAIYRRFVERRAHSLVLSVRDWEQILIWRERDIPLGLVLRVIDRNVERSEGEGRPLRLTELGPLVRSAWIELRKAEVGRPEEAEDEAETSFSMSFALSRILDPAVERLRGELRADAVGAALRETVDRAMLRLRRRQLSGLTTEQLLSWETRLNRRLLEVAEAEAPPEFLERARSVAEAAAAASPASSAELLRTKLYQISVRRLLGVPRLRLFQPGG